MCAFRTTMGLFAAISLLSQHVIAGDADVPHTFQPDTPAIAGEVNDNFNSLETAIDDNHSRISNQQSQITGNDGDIADHKSRISTNETDIADHESRVNQNTLDVSDNEARITDLESRSPTMGRIVVPVVDVTIGASIDSGYGILPDDVSTTAYGGTFGMPTDYQSGSVTVKAMISGCEGSTVAYQTSHPILNRVDVGDNFNPINLSCLGAGGNCPTVSISVSQLGFYVVEVSGGGGSLKDLNQPRFTRAGSNTADTCNAPIELRAFVIEYPRG